MFTFMKKALSEGAPDYEPSAGRIISFLCTLFSIGWITHIIIHSHALPDVATLGGITAFNTAHYAANRLAGLGDH